MIINEIYKIENHLNKDEIGILFDNLYDEFRDGRDRNDILILLNSEIEKMRYYGCDILNETRIIDNKFFKKITDKLNDILEKDTSDLNKIRAFQALYGIYLDNKDIASLFFLCQKNKDNSQAMIKNSSNYFIKKHETKPLNCSFHEFKEYLFNRD